MIVPTYWAEVVIKHKERGRQATIKRFGWSDISQYDAQQEAQRRAEDALKDWLDGKLITLRETKVNYNGADGLPIREQIISKHGDVVITRNSYGALCLNTPDVMFADIDFDIPYRVGGCLQLLLFALLIGGIVSLVNNYYEMNIIYEIKTIIYEMPIIFAILFIMLIAIHLRIKESKDPFESNNKVKIDEHLNKINAFLEKYPQWGIRVYETPAGLRLLVTHKTMSPNDPEVELFFKLMEADPVYARMCKNQQCFRARVSPKPWRVDMSEHISPRSGTWPIGEQYMSARENWIKQYENKAKDYAACRFIQHCGSTRVDRKVLDVIKLHDKLSKAETDCPIA